jgi:hypothetical protein
MTDELIDNTTYLPQQTIRYSTYIKTGVVQALREPFQTHVDELLRATSVDIENPKEKTDYPLVLVKFYEREIKPVGVGGGEMWIDLSHIDEDFAGAYRFKKSFYWADLEFEIQTLSSWDRDLVGDSLVQTIQMGQLESYTNSFFNRIYPTESDMVNKYPDSVWHYVSINTDQISGFGETVATPPWNSEDDKVYKKSYRVPVFGEFYSLPPDAPAGLVEAVLAYPYIMDVDEVPEGNPDDDGEWQPPLGV